MTIDYQQDMATTVPIVMTTAGVQSTPPTTLLNELIALVAATNPGYTANLPGSLIEDISSTDVGALALIDAAMVDLINSITPYGANQFILNQLGQIYGVQQGQGSNTSVYVTFSGSPGYVISAGFIVSDGSQQYIVQDGGIIQSSGASAALYCLAINQGSWAVPVGTVTQIVSSVPSGVTLTCTNLTAGLPGATAQPLEAYQAQVIQAGLATAQGMPTFLKTQLLNVSGVQPNLVSVKNVTSSSWEVICGGGDPYAVANAIFQGLPDISMLVGSTLQVAGITNANPGVVTTNLNHGYTTGQTVVIAGVTPSAFNGTYTATVLSPTTFSIGVNTSSFGTYTSGGVVTPNLRNVTVSINDYPDTYSITFVNPPVQTVVITVTWNTISANLVSPSAVAALATPALVAYINSITVGQPINTFELQDTFQKAIAFILPIQLISKINFSVAINGITTAPASGTFLIYGDPESYFSTSNSLITVTQG
jgi:hypothetical protein